MNEDVKKVFKEAINCLTGGESMWSTSVEMAFIVNKKRYKLGSHGFLFPQYYALIETSSSSNEFDISRETFNDIKSYYNNKNISIQNIK